MCWSGSVIAVANHRRDHRADPRARPIRRARASRSGRPAPGRRPMSRRWWRWSASPAASVADDGTYRLSDEQARAILDLRLQRLTGLERDKIAEELQRAGHARSRAISRS